MPDSLAIRSLARRHDNPIRRARRIMSGGAIGEFLLPLDEGRKSARRFSRGSMPSATAPLPRRRLLAGRRAHPSAWSPSCTAPGAISPTRACHGCGRRNRIERSSLPKKSCGQALGEAWPRANRSGTGRGGDVTGSRVLLSRSQSLALAVETAGLVSPSETQTLGSLCDWRLTKR